MFGWEFPPHIAGGLGTACHGLTEAMLEQGEQVLFVVPKLFGDEVTTGPALVDASSIEFEDVRRPPVREEQQQRQSKFITEYHPDSLSHLLTVQVPVQLDPYYRGAPHTYPVEDWNYQFAEGGVDAIIAGDGPLEKAKVKHPFQGGYGKYLRREVLQLSKVAMQLAGDYEFDVIHVHDWMTFAAGAAAKKRSGKPLVVHVHSTEYDRANHFPDRWVIAQERKGLAAADAVVAVSGWTKQILIDRYNVPADKITVIHNGVVATDFPLQRMPRPVEGHIVTFLGRMTHQKGPQYFVEAARKVLPLFPDTQFVMAGAGDLFPRIVERVAHLRLSGNIHFTGFLDHAGRDKLLSITDVYVMPSVSEPFGITPLEAVQAGIPVVISRQSGVAEVLPHALQVDFWDINALAQSICALIKFKSLDKTLRENSKQYISEISWKKAAIKLKQLYHDITQPQR